MNELVCTRLVKERAVAYDPSLHADTEYLPCEGCGRWVNDYERHHRKFRSRGGLWEPANVLLLCKHDHLGATDERPFAVKAGFNVGTTEDPAAIPVDVWYAGFVLLTDAGGWFRL